MTRPPGLTGTARLLRLAARGDRVLIPLSVVALALLVVGSARATIALYPDPQTALGPLQAALANPAVEALYGPITSRSLDSFATFKTVLLGAVFLALLACVVVRRHTRTDEEQGRVELVAATAVGRQAPLAAAVLLGSSAVIAAAATATLGGVAVGLDPAGSVALGTAWTVVGLTWVGITAVAAQLAQTSHGTTGLALGSLALSYLMRALGDVAPGDSPLRVLTWLSPVGWGEKVAPYGANRCWLIGPALVVFVALVTIAFAVQARRDLGSGVLPGRVGPARGRLRTTLALTLRLTRGTLLGWTLAFVVLGAVVGSLAENVSAFVDSPGTAALLRTVGGSEGAIIDTFFATELHAAAAAAAALGVGIVARMRVEESSLRVETLLATRVSRVRWALEHVVLAVIATAALMTTAAAVAGLLDAGRSGGGGASVARLAAAGLATAPAVWVCIGVATLIYGLAPRWTAAAWASLIAFSVVGEFGGLLGVPSALTALSPFAHLPMLPGGEFDRATAAALCTVALACSAVGLASLRRRDLPVG